MYVYSTLACDNKYVNYRRGGGDLPSPIEGGVLIKGGAGVANDRIITPRGVATEVTAEQVDYLMSNPEFLAHQSRGFVKLEEAKIDEERAASDMNAADESRQLTDGDFAAETDEGNGVKATTEAADGKPAKSRK